jgi:hypothetical protein
MIARLPMGMVVVALGAAACGRIGIDEADRSDGPVNGADANGSPDGATVDATAIDGAPAVCPLGTTEIAPGATVCIEITERGYESWTFGNGQCLGLGRRLCADAEWANACVNATGLVDMANDGGGANPEWEWVAEESGGIAQKRGFSTCDERSTHDVGGAYDYRCCVDLAP